MKLINSVGPNPHVVRMFAAERGITLTLEDIDILKGKNREGDYLKTNPSGQTPALVLEDGAVDERCGVGSAMGAPGRGRHRTTGSPAGASGGRPEIVRDAGFAEDIVHRRI